VERTVEVPVESLAAKQQLTEYQSQIKSLKEEIKKTIVSHRHEISQLETKHVEAVSYSCARLKSFDYTFILYKVVLM